MKQPDKQGKPEFTATITVKRNGKVTEIIKEVVNNGK